MSTVFDALTPEQQQFLIAYIKHSGNFDKVIDELAIPNAPRSNGLYDAKIMLLGVQDALGVPDKNYKKYTPQWPYTTKKHPTAADLVRAGYFHQCLSNRPQTLIPYYYAECYINGGGDDYIVWYFCTEDRIICSKNIHNPRFDPLRKIHFRYEILDMIVDCLVEHQGTLPKGSQTGKNAYARGTIAYSYKTMWLDKSPVVSGEGSLSVYYAILSAAGIIHNEKNTISLTKEYIALL